MQNKTKVSGYLLLIGSLFIVLQDCIGYRLGTCDPHYSWVDSRTYWSEYCFPCLLYFTCYLHIK